MKLIQVFKKPIFVDNLQKSVFGYGKSDLRYVEKSDSALLIGFRSDDFSNFIANRCKFFPMKS